jgi:hypothetical protein
MRRCASAGYRSDDFGARLLRLRQFLARTTIAGSTLGEPVAMINLPAIRIAAAALAAAACLTAPAVLAAGGTAKGTLTYKAKSGPITIAPKFAYLVKGPDGVETSKTIRKLIFTTVDSGARIEACTTMSCTESGLSEGMTVDLDGGPRLNYWVVLNGQRVQYSGTEPPGALKLTTDTPQRLAGTLTMDGARAGGPQVAIEFDTPLVKEMTKAR